MRRIVRVGVAVAASLIMFALERTEAATFNLLENGTFSIVGDLPLSYEPSLYGSVAIDIQAIENYTLPDFNPSDPMHTVGIYQWVAPISVFSQNGTPVPEPNLSPFGVALTGYAQNCYDPAYCPNPSGASSSTVLNGTLWISDNATIQIATTVFGLNVVSSNLEFELALPNGLSITPLPAAFPLFASGLGAVALLGWRRKRKRLSVSPPGLGSLQPQDVS